MADLKELENELSILIQRQQNEIQPNKQLNPEIRLSRMAINEHGRIIKHDNYGKDFIDQGWPGKDQNTLEQQYNDEKEQHGKPYFKKIRQVKWTEITTDMSIREHGLPFTKK